MLSNVLAEGDGAGPNGGRRRPRLGLLENPDLVRARPLRGVTMTNQTAKKPKPGDDMAKLAAAWGKPCKGHKE